MALTKIDDRGLKTPIDLIDSEKIRFGTGNDLEIYHTGVYSLIANTTGDLVIRNTGDTYLQSDSNIIIGDVGNNEKFIKCVDDGAVELYYDNTKTFETISGGVTVTGTGYVSGGWRPLTDNAVSLGSGSYRWYDLNISNDIKISDGGKIQLGAGPDLEIYSDGTNSFIQCPDTGNNLTLESDQHLYIKVGDSEDAVKCVNGAQVELYYDNSKKLATTSGGVHIYNALNTSGAIGIGNGANLTLEDNGRAVFGFGPDLQIYHDGSNSYIEDTGTGSLILRTGRVSFNDTGNNEMGRFDGEGLKFNGDSAAANGLDDYEEGTWTPTVAGSPTDLSVSGEYRKIGKMVSFNGFVSLTSHSNTSTTHISGLPFSGLSNKTFSVTVGNYRFLNLDGGYNQFMIDMAGTTMTLREQGDNTNYQNISWDQISNDFQVYFSGVYYTA